MGLAVHPQHIDLDARLPQQRHVFLFERPLLVVFGLTRNVVGDNLLL
jgi:hypothetical protein